MKRVVLMLLLCTRALFCTAQSQELRQIQASLPQIRDSTLYVNGLNRMAMLLYEKNMDSTFFYTKQAREIAGRIGYDKGNTDALNNLGVFFDIKGNFQLALRYYDEGYSGYQKLKDSANCVQALMNIAMVYKEQGKDQRGIRYFNDAIALGKKISKDSVMSLAIYNYLLAYPNKFSHDSTDIYIKKARQIAAAYHDHRTLIAIDQLVADDLIAHGKPAEGILLLQQTIQKALDKSLYYGTMDMLTDLGDRFAVTNLQQAADTYHQGLSIAGKNGYLFYSLQFTQKLFDLYSTHHDSLSAASYSRQLVALYNEKDRQERTSGVDYLDYAVKDAQVRSLTFRSTYQLALIILFLLACILAVVVLLVIRRNLRRTELLNAQIMNKNSEMQRALGALEQSQADNTRMMQIVAHDLRNPIGGMFTVAGMMLEEADRNEHDRMMLELIRTSGQNSLDLVSDLLQVQFKTEELKKEPVDIAEMLRYCVSLSENKASNKGQHIELRSGQAIIITASREKLWRVVSNLIANAIKFSPTGAAIVVRTEQLSNNIRISVKDEGIGIPAKMRDKIFDLFTEAKRPGTSGEQAFGLGLAISKQIVEAHGGSIWFESEPGKGTTFFVDLPENN